MHSFDMQIPVGYFVETEEEARLWLERLLKSHEIVGSLGLDTETTGLKIMSDRVVIWSLSDGINRICLPAKFLQLYKEPLLENPNINFDMTNPKYDAHILYNMGIDISKAGRWMDTIVQSWLLNENNVGRHGLKECTVDHFGRVTPTFEQIFGKITKRAGETTAERLDQALSDPGRRVQAADYASLDAYNSTTLRGHLDNLLERIETGPRFGNLKNYYHAVEVPFSKVLWKCERRGCLIDRARLESIRTPITEEMESIEGDISRSYGQPINVNSLPQLRKLFFVALGKKPLTFTKGGTSGNRQPSIDASTLEEWAGQGDAISMKLLRYRTLAKLRGTYVDGILERLDPINRIHTTFVQTGAATGRLSSRDPNLQNIPAKDEFGIRKAFITAPDRELIVCDYSQVEMRLMAHISQDPKMLDAIRNDVDLHCLTVAEMHGIPYDEVYAAKKAEGDIKKGKRTEPLTEREHDLLEKRSAAKRTGFGILYGIQGPHLAADLTKETGKLVSPREGNNLIHRWFSVFPGVKNSIDLDKERIWTEGRVQTLAGRFRRFGDLHALRASDAAQAERQGVNARVQGSSADITRMAMILCEHDEGLRSMDVRMLLSVHDELMFECPSDPELVKNAKARIKAIMEFPYSDELSVALPVDPGSGRSWAEAK